MKIYKDKKDTMNVWIHHILDAMLSVRKGGENKWYIVKHFLFIIIWRTAWCYEKALNELWPNKCAHVCVCEGSRFSLLTQISFYYMIDFFRHKSKLWDSILT